MDSDPNYILIGRIVVSKKERGNSLGSYLLDFIIKKIHEVKPKRLIKISAQAHLEKFYTDHGFKKQAILFGRWNSPHLNDFRIVRH